MYMICHLSETKNENIEIKIFAYEVNRYEWKSHAKDPRSKFKRTFYPKHNGSGTGHCYP